MPIAAASEVDSHRIIRLIEEGNKDSVYIIFDKCIH